MTADKKIRVLVVDDSKIIHDLMKRIFSLDEEVEVVAYASDPYEARDLIKQLNPDVVTLDIMMPRMDGITFLKNLMRLRPTPVVMVSSLTEENQKLAIEALQSGAIDYIAKPTQKELENINDYAYKLITMIKVAAHANVKFFNAEKRKDKSSEELGQLVHETDMLSNLIIAIGASIGGVEALETIITSLPKVFPPIVAVLHIRSEFIQSFVQRMNSLSNLTVQTAEDGKDLMPGNIYFAPSNHHFVIKKSIKGYSCALDDSPSVQGHKPSIDALFKSVAFAAGPNSVGVLLTGMGKDGAEGLKMLKERGGETIAQDEITSVVWGMPGAAVKLGAVDHVIPLQDIAKNIMSALDRKMRK